LKIIQHKTRIDINRLLLMEVKTVGWNCHVNVKIKWQILLSYLFLVD